MAALWVVRLDQVSRKVSTNQHQCWTNKRAAAASHRHEIPADGFHGARRALIVLYKCEIDAHARYFSKIVPVVDRCGSNLASCLLASGISSSQMALMLGDSFLLSPM
jgi:hypothetical protein